MRGLKDEENVTEATADRSPVPPVRPQPVDATADARRIAVIACVLLVTLRLFIGWQLAYEGFWKVSTLDTNRPWTSEGYLKNAQGPFRNAFRNMTGDPDDRTWLDYDSVNAKWNARYVAFDEFYQLSDQQKRQLNVLFEGPPDFRAELDEFPEGAKVPENLANFVEFNPQTQRIIVDGKRHLTQKEKLELLALVDDVLKDEQGALREPPEMNDGENYTNWELARKYSEAIERVFQRATRLSYRERLDVATRIDPEAPRIVFGGFKGTIGDKYTPIDSYYSTLLEEYEEARATAETDYQREHAETLYGEIVELKNALVGPVKALDAQLTEDMYGILTPEQRAKGPLPHPWDTVRIADTLTITGLCTLGTLLLIGFLTRFAAAMAGVMVLGFYLAWPPWPGVIEAPGPDHSLVVNKNLIEVMALFALAALPTGRWFGVDGLLVASWHRMMGRRNRVAAENAVPAAPAKSSAAKPSAAKPVAVKSEPTATKSAKDAPSNTYAVAEK
ncbi:DoxX family protein [Alienimonas chondri]|uniref:DoxX family protein n=1 Tax=Alienimonas chondri TaxID=2681879 RepID=A0ABX1VHQ4_9PLAN|nr:DoxX family protein [Alienimonas chondri]NNJ27611.1 hypothetical protein [Alienimonas chondri]